MQLTPKSMPDASNRTHKTQCHGPNSKLLSGYRTLSNITRLQSLYQWDRAHRLSTFVLVINQGFLSPHICWLPHHHHRQKAFRKQSHTSQQQPLRSGACWGQCCIYKINSNTRRLTPKSMYGIQQKTSTQHSKPNPSYSHMYGTQRLITHITHSHVPQRLITHITHITHMYGTVAKNIAMRAEHPLKAFK